MGSEAFRSHICDNEQREPDNILSPDGRVSRAGRGWLLTRSDWPCSCYGVCIQTEAHGRRYTGLSGQSTFMLRPVYRPFGFKGLMMGEASINHGRNMDETWTIHG